MTPKDRRLLAEVLRWARTQGWRPVYRGSQRPADWHWTNVHRPRPLPLAREARQVYVDRSGTLFVRAPSSDGCGWTEPHRLVAESVTQAVDVLAALRILPVAFSSAFRSGQALGLYVGGRFPCVHEAVKATTV